MKILAVLMIFLSVILSVIIIMYDFSDQIFFIESVNYIEEPYQGIVSELKVSEIIDKLETNFDSFVLISPNQDSSTVGYYAYNFNYLPEYDLELYDNYKPINMNLTLTELFIKTPDVSTSTLEMFLVDELDVSTFVYPLNQNISPISTTQLYILRVISVLGFTLSLLIYLKAYKNEIIVYNLLNKSRFFIFKKISLKYLIILIISYLCSFTLFYKTIIKVHFTSQYLEIDYSSLKFNIFYTLLITVLTLTLIYITTYINKVNMWRKL